MTPVQKGTSTKGSKESGKNDYEPLTASDETTRTIELYSSSIGVHAHTVKPPKNSACVNFGCDQI